MKLIIIIKRIIVLLLFISFITSIWATWNYNLFSSKQINTTYTNIRIPIDFSAGKQYAKQFNIEKSELYEISIRCYRLVSDNLLDSLLGTTIDNNYKNDFPISFTLSNNDSVLLSIDTVDSYSFSSTNDYKARIVGVFTGNEDKSYNMVLKINKTIQGFNKTNPELVISVVPAAYKNDMVKCLIQKILFEKLMIYSISFFFVFLIAYIITIIIIKKTA